MALRDDLKDLTPRLRRYARALSSGSPASNEMADDLVHATLMRALGARYLGDENDLAVRLFATVTQIHRDFALSGRQVLAAGVGQPASILGTRDGPMPGHQTKLSSALLSLPLEDREALLLVGLEGFEHGEAARILRISRSALIARLTAARMGLDTVLAAHPLPVGRRATVPYLRLVRS